MNREPKAHGLLFSSEMILALLNTKPDVWPARAIDSTKPFKSQTRRVMKYQPSPKWTELGVESIRHATRGIVQQATYRAFPDGGSARWAICECPHSVGTVIYAKETFWADVREPKGLVIYETPRSDGLLEAKYKNRAHVEACDAELNLYYLQRHKFWNRKPSIFMPKWSSRIWLCVKNVRVERVNSITESDANAEGIPSRMSVQTLTPAVAAYAELWDDINGKGSWLKNPWVWRYGLARVTKPEGE